MRFRSILGGAVAAVLLLSAPALAAPEGLGGGFLDALKPGAGLRGIFGGAEEQRAPPPVRLAQAGDPRITQLEEQIRVLSGTVEELNFQVLQMQEQMRKMQEDNEFRFQELESGGGQKKSDAGSNAERSVAAADTAEEPPAAAGGLDAAAAGSEAGAAPGGTQTFGTITFDAKGNVVGGGIGDQAITPSAAPPSDVDGVSDQTTVAALPPTDDPEELYRNSYEFILSGDYATAEAGFRDHLARFPGDAKTPDAHFWLGEALLGQAKYRDAAEIFLAANRDYPDSKKAPDMLLKLGVSLAGLNQREVACATFGEVDKRYPKASAALKERVKQEKARAGC